MHRPLTSRQRCGTALVLGESAYIAAAEEAVDRRCRRKPRGETLAACIPIPFDERWVLSRHHRRQKGLPLAFVSRSPYHEGVRFSRYELRSALARH